MNFVNTTNELKKQAAKLGKREVKVIKDRNRNHVLVGTNLAYEDELYQNVSKTFDSLQKALGLKPAVECPDIYVYKSELRDSILEYVLHANNADITYGSNEY